MPASYASQWRSVSTALLLARLLNATLILPMVFPFPREVAPGNGLPLSMAHVPGDLPPDVLLKLGEVETGFVSQLSMSGFTKATCDTLSALLNDATFTTTLTRANFESKLISVGVPITTEQAGRLTAPHFLDHSQDAGDTRIRHTVHKRKKRNVLAKVTGVKKKLKIE